MVSGEIPARVPIEMNGLKLSADLLRGQKTGVYLDQRENYLAAARYARGRVLDCFSSTGGFALHLAGKVESVEAESAESAEVERVEAERTGEAVIAGSDGHQETRASCHFHNGAPFRDDSAHQEAAPAR